MAIQEMENDASYSEVEAETEFDLAEIAAADEDTDRAAGPPHHSDSDRFDATRMYLRELAKSRLLTPSEEQHYGRLAREGDLSACRIMVESNLRLVVKICRRYLNRGMPLLDIIEEGNLGLIHAVAMFDVDRGFRFSTYATWWIRQHIERALMRQTRTIQLPVYLVKELNSYLRALRYLTERMEHTPRARDVADYLQKPVATVERVLSLNEKIASLDGPAQLGSDQALIHTISAADQPSLPDQLQQEVVMKKLAEWLDCLTERQRDILHRRFGLGGGDPETLDEVAQAVGLTQEGVRQAQMKALRQLRSVLEVQGFSAESLFH